MQYVVKIKYLIVFFLVSFLTTIHGIQSISSAPGESNWSISKKIGEFLDEASTTYAPVMISDSYQNSSTITLSTPGAYRLSENMTKPIAITSSNVELNLGGYGIVGAGGNPCITVGGAGADMENVFICNGYLRAIVGISLDNSTDELSGVCIKDVQIFGTFLTTGIDSTATSHDIYIFNVKIHGINIGIRIQGNRCSIISCFVSDCTTSGIDLIGDYNVISNCYVWDSGDGFSLSGDYNWVKECTAMNNTSDYGLGVNNHALENVGIQAGVLTWYNTTVTP